jgi:simple sugar transport system ATP-binding protein/ribose transport system ATP-binding protein
VRRGVIKDRFEELTKTSGIIVPNDRPVSALSIGDQQKVEILRALARNAEVIVMDEPTARLSVEETAVLKDVMRSLRDQGKTIIFVSHFLGDVLDVSDAITIMRDGRIIRTSKPSDETHDSLVEAMTGRKAGDAFPAKTPPNSPAPVLEVNGLTRGVQFADISFTVGAGEIVALAGLVGSGRSEVARAIYGADPIDSGEVKLQGSVIKISHPATAIENGIVMIPESRKDQGLILDRSIRENISLPYLKKLSQLLMKRREENSMVAENFAAAGIRALSSEMTVRSLSGGNQQKALFARSLAGHPTLFIADEPTRGVDVGSKRAIYELLADLAQKGMAVLVISSELEEVVGLAHRVIVMQTGRIVAELVGDQISESAVVSAAFSMKQREGLAS